MTLVSTLVPDKKAICSDCNKQIYEEDGTERVEKYYIDLANGMNIVEDVEMYMRCNSCLDEVYEENEEFIDAIIIQLTKALIIDPILAFSSDEESIDSEQEQ